MSTDFLTIADVAERLGMSLNGTYAAAKAGQIPAVRIGGLWRVPVLAWDRYLSGEWTPATRQESDKRLRAV